MKEFAGFNSKIKTVFPVDQQSLSNVLAAQKHNNDHKNNIDNLENDLKIIWCPIQQMRDPVFFFFNFT